MKSYVEMIKNAIRVEDDTTAIEVERLMLAETPNLDALTPGQFDELSRRAFTEYARRLVDAN